MGIKPHLQGYTQTHKKKHINTYIHPITESTHEHTNRHQHKHTHTNKQTKSHKLAIDKAGKPIQKISENEIKSSKSKILSHNLVMRADGTRPARGGVYGGSGTGVQTG